MHDVIFYSKMHNIVGMLDKYIHASSCKNKNIKSAKNKNKRQINLI